MIGLLLAALAFAGSFPIPVEGSTYRILDVTEDAAADVRLGVFASREDCHMVQDEDGCVPLADRARGQVRLGFQVQDQTGEALATAIDDFKVRFDARTVQDVELVGKEPEATSQLFILLLDWSGSMFEDDQIRAKLLLGALVTPRVVEAMFRPGARNGVMILRFTDHILDLDGGVRIIRSADEYVSYIRRPNWERGGGYTHLYEAIGTVLEDVLRRKEVERFLSDNQAQPTIVALTDGFNNESPGDLCGTNVDRLNDLLKIIDESQRPDGGRVRPVIHTIGLGDAYQSADYDRIGRTPRVNEDQLCHKAARSRIDGFLETRGIDHISLGVIAAFGGGTRALVPVGAGIGPLARVFESTAAQRFRWYQAWFQVPSEWHRKTFDVRLEIQGSRTAGTTVRMEPDPWFDGPTGLLPPGKAWSEPRPLASTFAFMMPWLGGLLLLLYLPAAWTNTRRSLTRRVPWRQRR